MTQLAVVRRGASPRVLEARATLAGGRTTTLSGTTLRGRLGLRDTWFSVTRTPAHGDLAVSAARALAAGLAVAAGLAWAAAPASAADPILPLAEVTPGMVGEARTVVRGTQIVTFPVSVIDVQRTTDGPGGSLILVRAEGPLMETTGGVAEGMSGSPVYVTGADGVARVIGAIAYGSGDQANVIVGVTPIEQMIDSSSGQRANAVAPTTTPARRATLVRSRAAARRLEARHPGRIGLYPLARWTLAGVSRPVAATLSKALASSGIQLTSIGPRTPRPAVPLVPGSSLTALISGGDVVLGAIGTTTYVDGATVLGFGHPFLGAGRTRFLMGDGYVYQTIAAPIAGSSYKLGEPGTIQGMLVGDRADGLTGRLGPGRGHRGGEHRDRRRPRHPEHGARHDRPRRAHRPHRGRPGAGRAGGARARRPRRRHAAAVDLRLQPRPARAARLPQHLRRGGGRRLAGERTGLADHGHAAAERGAAGPDLVGHHHRSGSRAGCARRASSAPPSGPARCAPAGGATLILRVQPWRASPRVLRIPVRLPRDLFPGSSGITVVPKAPDGFDSSQPDLSQDLGVAAGVGGRSAAVARVERLARRAAGTRLERVVAGLGRANDDRHDAVRLLGPDDDAEDPAAGVTVPVPYVIYGGRAPVRVTVR